MSAEENLPPELKSLEAALGSLVPRADRLDRDRLLFEAGRASVAGVPRHVVRFAWPAAFAAMTATAAVLAVMVVARPGPEVVEKIVHVPAATPEVATPVEEAIPQRPPRRPAPPVPASRETSAPFLAHGPARGDWLSLRRDVVDVASLDRVLAARGPELEEPRSAGDNGCGESYRAMLDCLLGEGSRGG